MNEYELSEEVTNVIVSLMGIMRNYSDIKKVTYETNNLLDFMFS